MPHSGADYAAGLGTPVVASNRGRVALVGDFFFAGRLVVLDHGLGLYTLYFHLDRVDVAEGAVVERGQPIGTVGATGRATGPHLHWGAVLRQARVDPSGLLSLGPATDGREIGPLPPRAGAPVSEPVGESRGRWRVRAPASPAQSGPWGGLGGGRRGPLR